MELVVSRLEAKGCVPEVCVCCGQPAAHWRTRHNWPALWVYVLGLIPFPLFLIFGLAAFRRQCAVRLPFCNAHRNHWRRWTLWALLAVPFLVHGFIMALDEFLSYLGRDGREFMHWLYDLLGGNWRRKLENASAVLLFFMLGVWVLYAVIRELTAVRVKAKTKDWIHLTGLSPRFVEALESQRRKAVSLTN